MYDCTSVHCKYVVELAKKCFEDVENAEKDVLLYSYTSTTQQIIQYF